MAQTKPQSSRATVVAAMYYAGSPAYPATVVSEKPNLAGRTMRTVTDGFEFERIRATGATGRAAYLEHMADVLSFLRGEDISATGAADTPVANRLDQNVPNPFNPTTRITYSIARRGHVRIDVFDVSGRRVRTLVDAVQPPQPGGHAVRWDGTDQRGRPVASGVYFYRIQAPGFAAARKMVLLR